MLNAVCYLQSHTIVFLTEIVACGTAEECKAACGIEAGCSNFAYVSMVIGIMPTGKDTLLLAAMLSLFGSRLKVVFRARGRSTNHYYKSHHITKNLVS